MELVMDIELRTVILEGGELCLELTEIKHGGSESSMSYSYFHNGEEFPKKYETDYWGGMKSTVVKERYDLTELLKKISVQILHNNPLEKEIK